MNTPCIVTVRPAVPCAVFQAYIQAPQGNINLPITVHKSTKSGKLSVLNKNRNNFLYENLNVVFIKIIKCKK